MNWWMLKRKIHISWLIVVMCAGIFIGVFAAKYFKVMPGQLGVLLVASALFALVAFWKKYLLFIPAVLIGGMLFGLWRGSISKIELDRYSPLYGQLVVVKGGRQR